MADRQRGVLIHRPIIYGSHARLLSDAERKLAPPDHTHRWTIFLTSATSPPPKPGESEDMDYMPGGADDLSYLIRKVTFRLHETYPNPNRVLDKPPFRVSETGWGEFQVPVRVQFIPEASEKPLTLTIAIKLHHWGAPIEAAPPAPAPSTLDSAAPTPAAPAAVSSPAPKTERNDESGTNVGEESMGSAILAIPPNAPPDQDVPMEKKEDPGVDAEGEAEDTVVAARPAHVATLPPAVPLSVAAKYPVHAWQYDELVFSEPPLAFYNILNEHPPTPLPPRNRRARDQRDEHAQKKKKGRVSGVAASAASSRAGTPTGDVATRDSVPPAVGVPPAGAGVGIPGEPGSADVPLEFTAEMEKGEWNRLHETKKQVIEQMDKWRLRLIDEEKELARLKEELARTPMPV